MYMNRFNGFEITWQHRVDLHSQLEIFNRMKKSLYYVLS